MNIIGTIDPALIALYAFWIFFAGLVFYLRREDRREGYPLEDDRTGVLESPSPTLMPTPKTFHLGDGTTQTAPRDERDSMDLPGEPVGGWSGAPLEPTGNAMAGGIGPGAYANRRDEADVDLHGNPRIQPIGKLEGFSIVGRDPDPIGMTVYGADKAVGGTVNDVWVDRMEVMARYLEVETGSGNLVLLPIPFARIDNGRRRVQVNAITGGQFDDVPKLKSPDRITRLEEEKVSAYYGGGTLFSNPLRREPLI
ncbi:MAG: photosynthetic reaction center subunit H [Rhodospirillaceae bacterium]|nr:photosynthetic reaction center subunit H [Rhodospirillaceae bacterium]